MYNITNYNCKKKHKIIKKIIDISLKSHSNILPNDLTVRFFDKDTTYTGIYKNRINGKYIIDLNIIEVYHLYKNKTRLASRDLNTMNIINSIKSFKIFILFALYHELGHFNKDDIANDNHVRHTEIDIDIYSLNILGITEEKKAVYNEKN